MITANSKVLKALLKADLIIQWRNRRAWATALLLPVLIVSGWKNAIPKLGPYFVLSTAITLGLITIGLLGYAASLAKDRDKGIFQRLRVGPFPERNIIISRLLVQLIMILLLISIVFISGYTMDGILLSMQGYIITYVTALLAGAMFLGLGQLITGLVTNPETVNGATRLVYVAFVLIGMLGGTGALGTQMQQLALWSPYGVVKTIISTGMQPGHWTGDTTHALVLCVIYAVLFAGIGIRKFRWSTI